MRYKDKWEDYEYSYEDEMKFHLKWGNLTSALRWNYVIRPNLFSNATLTYSRYKIDIGDTWSWVETGPNINQSNEYAFSYISGIEDIGGKIDFDYMPNPNHTIRFGINNTNHCFKPGIQVTSFEQQGDITESLDTFVGNANIYANEMDIYVEDEIEIGGRVKANLGVHYSNFAVRDAWYHSLQPRVAARVLISQRISYKASYAEMMQFIHLLANSSLGLPTDLWVPATDATKPQRSKQVASGFAFDVGKNFELTVEGYYKIMEDVIEYKEGAEYFEVLETWENKIEHGKGWAYGGEIMLQKQAGNTTGWVCYTLSWANRQFENISQGKIFPYKYDRRHDVAIVVSHKFNDHIDGCITWVYGTGYHITLGEEMYVNPFYLFQDQSYEDPYQYFETGSNMIEHIENRNNYTMPAYHRMDAGINLHKEKKNFTRTWSFGAYNLYNRQNAFMIFADYDLNNWDYDQPLKKKIQQITLFPIIPYFRYSISF